MNILESKQKLYEKYEAKKIVYFILFCVFLIVAAKFAPWTGIDYENLGTKLMAFVFLVFALIFLWPIRDLFERKGE